MDCCRRFSILIAWVVNQHNAFSLDFIECHFMCTVPGIYVGFNWLQGFSEIDQAISSNGSDKQRAKRSVWWLL